MQENIDILDKAWTLAAGLFGMIIPLSFQNGLSKRQLVLDGTISMSAVVFLAPALCDYTGWVSGNQRAAVAFVTGMLALRLFQWVFNRFDDILGGYLKKVIGG